MNDGRVTSGAYQPEEDREEGSLRPRLLAEFLGQKQVKENMRVFIQAARERRESLDHVFFSGPPGLGKTTLAGIIANELGVQFRATSAPALERPGDLAAILTTIGDKNVFFIDEIHRLKPVIEEMLYTAMEDFEIDVVMGQGPGARTIKIPLPPFTLVGATTKTGLVSSPLYSRFGITTRLDFYTQEDIRSILHRSSKILGIRLDEEACTMIALRSRGTPRVANRLLRRMRDFAQVWSDGLITSDIVLKGMESLSIDALGLDKLDRDILQTIIRHYNGGPVGSETLAISVGEAVDTLEDVYEPYLIQRGLLQRTPRGRMVTALAYQHMQLEPAAGENQQFLF
ncbi:MAG: Holliday junction branch migration DNA helicase RuvB [Spirochaetales bacterium]|nr:Holliday junction branch migration DNA helicase RuvB [Spirochaetales bacterium]